MGCGTSTAMPKTAEAIAARQRDREIDKELRQESKNRVYKILLLGTGDSGKSTVLKQFQILHSDGLRIKEQLSQYKAIVEDNLAAAILDAVKSLEDHGRPVPEGARCFSDARKKSVLKTPLPAAQVVVEFWKYFQETSKDDYSILDDLSKMSGCPVYFLEHAKRMMDRGYVPTAEDCLHTRTKTTGIVETPLDMGSGRILVVDVGGQRTERRKWIHCFEGTDAVIFCVSLVDYARRLEEDSLVNRMDENVKLFDETCRTRWFHSSTFVLFLNKSDLLPKRLEVSPLQRYLPEYVGGTDVDSAIKSIGDLFVAKSASIGKDLYMHVTCATDTNGMNFVFQSLKNAIFDRAMGMTGFS